ncbi:hypothetical protein NEOLI_004328 [Neolecta irregularis DAH-3]|uniref:Uncharacterized protein n=1 Tax=Neolecta irregularis (strain DAH-3) TaxID=1198029 RepID=A0A1U7LTI1_NEOID|nr:hypothetical protein NEOLI_004328 [Neolecta irregularis DAH-3]|eukprot:OLL25954.1 hypothetical protein NEOLI_004328 [Neolecta irregularis DAH-3]
MRTAWRAIPSTYNAHRYRMRSSLDELYSIQSPSKYQLDAINIIAKLAAAEGCSIDLAKTKLLDALRPRGYWAKQSAKGLKVIPWSKLDVHH